MFKYVTHKKKERKKKKMRKKVRTKEKTGGCQRKTRNKQEKKNIN